MIDEKLMAGPIVQQSCREKSPIRSISMDHVWMPVTALCDNTNTKRSKPHSRRVRSITASVLPGKILSGKGRKDHENNVQRSGDHSTKLAGTVRALAKY